MTQANQSIELKPLDIETTSKFSINEKAFCFNAELQPLVKEMHIKGIIEKPEGIFYSNDHQNWIREDFLYKNRYSAYRSLIKQAEAESSEPHKVIDQA